MKRAVLSLIAFIPFISMAQIQIPDWNILDSVAVKRFEFNKRLFEQSQIIDSSTTTQKQGVRIISEKAEYTIGTPTGGMFVSYYIYKKGQNTELNRPGEDAIKEISIKGDYLSVAPIYISLFAPEESLETLKQKFNLLGYLKNETVTQHQWLFEKVDDKKWQLRIFNK